MSVTNSQFSSKHNNVSQWMCSSDTHVLISPVQSVEMLGYGLLQALTYSHWTQAYLTNRVFTTVRSLPAAPKCKLASASRPYSLLTAS